MENRLKERLTGAAILVALIVMLVPEMFHGQRGNVAAVAGSSGEGPPVRSYTIDLSNGATRAGPLQSTPVSGGNDEQPASAPASGPSTAVTGSDSSRTTRFGFAGGSLIWRSICCCSWLKSIAWPGDGTTNRIGTSPA